MRTTTTTTGLAGTLALLIAALPAHAQTDFSRCLARLERTALESGISAGTIESILPNVEPRESVIRADRNQPEFLATFADYLGRRATNERITQGRALYAEHRALLNELTQRYGVPGHYIVSFWGLETNYGRYLGNVPVFDSLSTLACDARRSEFFTEQFVNALEIVDRGDVEPNVMRGSWAGAMGQTQFMPSSYLRHAVDGDGDGRVDLWNSTADALTSAANFLRNIGWQSGYRWGREVLLPEGFDYALSGAGERRELRFWRDIGITDVAGRPLADLDIQAAVVIPSGQRGPAFVIYDNFDVIMRWNRSEYFALTVGHLADRIAGAGPLTNPPFEDGPISRDDVVRVQEYLVRSGYDGGTADGIFGSRSRAALRALQRDLGLVPDGFLSHELLRAMGLSE